jgi:hypothetical protein
MTPEDYFSSIKTAVAEDDLPTAYAELQKMLEGSPLLNELTLQEGRFAQLNGQIRQGTISTSDANLTSAQLRKATVDLVNLIEAKNDTVPAVAEEVATVAAKQTTIHQTADKIYNIEKIDKADFS